jgi:hypothetical protein
MFDWPRRSTPLERTKGGPEEKASLGVEHSGLVGGA